jgi:hypothetical protein
MLAACYSCSNKVKTRLEAIMPEGETKDAQTDYSMDQ